MSFRILYNTDYNTDYNTYVKLNELCIQCKRNDDTYIMKDHCEKHYNTCENCDRTLFVKKINNNFCSNCKPQIRIWGVTCEPFNCFYCAIDSVHSDAYYETYIVRPPCTYYRYFKPHHYEKIYVCKLHYDSLCKQKYGCPHLKHEIMCCPFCSYAVRHDHYKNHCKNMKCLSHAFEFTINNYLFAIPVDILNIIKEFI